MANKARIRVEAKWTGDSPSERLKASKYLITEFRRRVDDAGIKHILKEREFYESKSSKRRKKDRASKLRREHELLESESFSSTPIPLC
jgi:ribosomal protein S21